MIGIAWAAVLVLAAVSAGTAVPPPDYVHGTRIVFASGIERLGELGAPLRAPLLGEHFPLVVPSPTRGELLYHAWDGSARGAGVPVLRVYEREDAADRVLARGAQSAAWRRDGALAYMKATVPRYAPTLRGAFGGHYGQVVVRSSPGARPVAWTAEQRRRYVVVAWARQTLLVEIVASYLMRDRRTPGVYALDGPRRLRRLPIRELVAVSPDGRRAIGTVRTGDGPATAVRLVDVASGRPLASLPLRFVAGSGDWAGERVVARGRDGELVVLNVARGEIMLERRIRLPGTLRSRPVLVGGSRYVAVRVHERAFAGFVTCDRLDGRCARWPQLRPARVVATAIDNPSRPE